MDLARLALPGLTAAAPNGLEMVQCPHHHWAFYYSLTCLVALKWLLYAARMSGSFQTSHGRFYMMLTSLGLVHSLLHFIHEGGIFRASQYLPRHPNPANPSSSDHRLQTSQKIGTLVLQHIAAWSKQRMKINNSVPLRRKEKCLRPRRLNITWFCDLKRHLSLS